MLVANVVRLMGCMAIVVLMVLSVMAMRLLCVMLNRPISIQGRHHARVPCRSSVYQAIVLLVVSLIVHSGVILVVLGR